MNTLPVARRVQVISALVEGNSIRAAVRMTGVAKNTVVKLLAQIGVACSKYQDQVLRNLPCKRLQCDEIWSFCYAKEKNVPNNKKGKFGFGDVQTWTAICADTKLVPSWLIGTRGAGTAHEFMQDLAGRLTGRVQLTTDAHRVYLDAVESAFGPEIDYAMLVKLYGNDSESEITHLTNAFSKKVENHEAAIALHFMHYNFCRVHQTLRVTPAMEAGVTNHVWTIQELVALLDSN